MTEFTIRRFEQSDRDDVYDVLAEYIDSLDEYLFPVERFADRNDTDATACVAVEAESDRVVGVLALYVFGSVSEIQNKLKGVTTPDTTDLRPESSHPETVGYIASGYVHPDYLRQGLGKKLLNEVEAVGCEQGVETFYTELWGYDRGKDARPLFEKYGYSEVFYSDEYWPASLPEASVECSRCGDDCSCIGAIYRKVVDQSFTTRSKQQVAND